MDQQQKPFSFSFSKLKNYDTCPRRHYEIDIAKHFKEGENEILTWGNAVHRAFADRLGKGLPLPKTMEKFEPLMNRLEQVPGTKFMVEQKLAINQNFQPVGFFADDAWFRAVIDVLILNPPVALMIDYKAGKILDDSQQMALSATTVFAHYKEIEAVRTEFWWLKEDTPTRADFKRRQMTPVWRAVWPRIKQLEEAYRTGVYPAKPSGLCRKHCPVSTCEFYGKGG